MLFSTEFLSLSLRPASLQAMSDKFVHNVMATFQRGQTVMAKITNLDEEKRRFLVSLKCSDVTWSEGDAKTRLVNGLKERKTVAEMSAVRGTTSAPGPAAWMFNSGLAVNLCFLNLCLFFPPQITAMWSSSWLLCPSGRSSS